MTGCVTGCALLSAKNTIAEQIDGSIGHSIPGTIPDEPADRASSQEAYVGDSDLAGGSQGACCASAVSAAITGFNGEIAQRNEIEKICALIVSGGGLESRSRQSNIHTGANRSAAVAAENGPFDAARGRQGKIYVS